MIEKLRMSWVLLVITAIVVAILAAAGGFFVGKHQGTTSYALASGGTVTPGTNFATATTLDEDTFDATIFGPGVSLDQSSDITDVHRRNPADPFTIGALDAPVVISEFSDTECPYCARYANNTVDQIVSKYVDTGLVRIEWNDMPINGEHALAGAKALRAAAEQGKFQEFKKELFSHHDAAGGHPEFSIDDYVTFATTVGVADLEKFRTHASDDTFTEPVNSALAYGQEIGVSGTPSFLIGSQFVSGAQPIENFERAILGELAMSSASES